MASASDAFRQWIEAVDKKSYYEILRVAKDAKAAAIKAAFHQFALTYHPDQFTDEPREIAVAAAEVFKRGAEAYRVLSRPSLRERYDKALAQGKKRFDEKAVTEPPPRPQGKTLEQVAKTPRGKQFAIKADRLLSIGKLEEARLQLVNACQNEPDNQELAERLNLVYEALALEPL